MHNLSYTKLVGLQDNKHASKTNFHMKGCAPGLVLKQTGERHLENGQFLKTNHLFLFILNNEFNKTADR